MAQQQQQKSNVVPWLVGGFIALKVFDYFTKDSEEEKEEKKNREFIENLAPEDNPFLYNSFKLKASELNALKAKGKTKTNTLTSKQYFDNAIEIKKAWGYLNDNEAAVIAQLNKCRTKGDVSLLSRAFAMTTQDDLYFDLKSRLSSSELNEILRTVIKLPAAV